ncbi:hypothetical protein GBA52_019810 [Prunus armeniaca]|nr:hypothetical protein GBA52_019810 [Prunus armeniaca]
MLFRFKVSSARPPRGSLPILFREGSTIVMHYCSPKNMELIWFDKNEDEFDKGAVCSRQDMLEGLDFGDDMIAYVESMLPFLPNISGKL